MKKKNLGRRILSLVLTFTILQLLAPDNALLAQETESTPVIDVVEEDIKLSSELQGEAPTNGSCGDNLTLLVYTYPPHLKALEMGLFSFQSKSYLLTSLFFYKKGVASVI